MNDGSPITVAGILAVLGGVTAMLVAVITAWRTGAKVDKVVSSNAVIAATATEVSNVLNTVEKNTNSRADKQDNKIEQLLSQVAGLTAHIAKQDETRAVLAAEVNKVVQQMPPVPVVVTNEQPVDVSVVQVPQATVEQPSQIIRGDR